jgi:hypothetical protein
MPLGVTFGSFDQTLDMLQASSYNPAFITANGGTTASAEAVLFAGIMAGTTYFNIHTAAPNGFPGGEIRGFLVRAPSAVPEPNTLVMLTAGLIALVALYRKRLTI